MPWIEHKGNKKRCTLPTKKELAIIGDYGRWLCPDCGREWGFEKEQFTGTWIKIPDTGHWGCGD